MQGEHGLHNMTHSRTQAKNGGWGVCHWLIAAWAGFLFIGLSGQVAGATKPAGDLAPLTNPDGVLNAADALILQRFIMGSLTPSAEQILLGDVAPLGSPDGVLNAGDLVVLMRAIQGQITLPPVYLGPDPPVLNAVSGSTSANPYQLTGTAAAGLEVRLYLNGDLYTTTPAMGAEGAFNVELILKDGQNQIYAVVVEAGSEGPASALLNLDYVNNIPRAQGGVITQDQVWTPGFQSEPYVIGSGLTLASGATLTLQPGTIVRFGPGSSLNVDGVLTVLKDATATVLFTSDNETAAVGDWAGIHIRAGSQGSRIDGAIIEYAASGVSVDASQAELRNCTIRNFGPNRSNYGIGFINGASGIVEDCVIDNSAVAYNNANGIYLASSSQPEIRGNFVTNTNYGIFVEEASPWISGNTTRNNTSGIYLYHGAKALVNGGNIISQNTQAGIQFDGAWDWEIPGSIVKDNSIFNNRLNVYISGYTSFTDFEIDLTGNWWGSTSPSVISSSIWDYKDVWGNGTPPARIAPFLDSPSGQPVDGNFLNGRISKDTTLQAGEPYTLMGSYVLPPDAALTILPGTLINLASNAALYASGNLTIQGETNNRVVFGPTNDIGALPPAWGLIIGDLSWYGTFAQGSVTGASFENMYMATEVGAAAADIVDSHYLNNHYRAVSFQSRSSGSVLRNTIEGYKNSIQGGTKGIHIRALGITIADNIITGMDYGIDGGALIKGNTVQGNTYGIVGGDLVQDNTIQTNTYGIYNCGIVNSGNTIIENDFGIYSSYASIVANNNNIHSNGYNYYKANTSYVDDATNNWWGTSDESQIAAGIFSQTAGGVDYIPFLTGPVPPTPRLTAGSQLVNTVSYAVSGSAQSGAQIRIYVNTVEQLIVDVQPDGTFSGAVNLIEGANSLYAEAFNSTTSSAPSNTITVTLDTVPPVLTLSAPVSGDLVNTYPMFTGSIDEPATLTIMGLPATLANDNSFSHGPVALAEGLNNVGLIATDLAGNTTTRNITLTLDTTPPPDLNMGLVTYSILNGGNVTVTGGAGASEADARIYVANARTGETTLVIVDAEGAFTASIAAQPGDMLTLVATDALGNQTAWNQEVVAGAAVALSISATTPSDGVTINGTQITISGLFQGPEGTGIVVNGQVAEQHADRFLANNIPLVSGANTIEIIATTPEGETYTHTMTLTSTGSIPFSVRASPDTGTAPFVSTLTVTNDTGYPIQLLQYDLNDDGTYEQSYSNLNYSEVWIGVLYSSAGVQRGRIHVVDSTGTGYDLPFGVTVEDPIGKQARLRAVYHQMLSRLGQGDIPGALNRIMGTSRDRFEQVFTHLSADFQTVIAGLGVVDSVEIGPGLAQLRVVRDTAGQKRAYFVTLVRSSDGIWRVEDM